MAANCPNLGDTGERIDLSASLEKLLNRLARNDGRKSDDDGEVVRRKSWYSESVVISEYRRHRVEERAQRGCTRERARGEVARDATME